MSIFRTQVFSTVSLGACMLMGNCKASDSPKAYNLMSSEKVGES